jgi:hypothetical protein
MGLDPPLRIFSALPAGRRPAPSFAKMSHKPGRFFLDIGKKLTYGHY